MSKINFYLSILTARILSIIIAVLHRSSGTSFIGVVVLKICPNFLSYCSKYVVKNIITISGTNGKTTTAGILANILESNNQRIIHNKKGANMLTGIANTLSLSILPYQKFDYYILESDEAYLTKLYDYLPSDYLLVTNLFRDQLDRYGELDSTAKKIQEAIDKNPKLKLFLNADDPMVTNLGSGSKRIYFGFDNVKILTGMTSNAHPESVNCPLCGASLKYNKKDFAQQSHYYCDCGYKRPQCKYSASVEILKDCSIIKLKSGKSELEFNIDLIGLYSAYNALASISLALELGYKQSQIQNALNSYRSIFGRAEKLIMREHEVLIQLIKNPTGATEVLKTVDLSSNILIIINDKYADGRDVSWLWDTGFEYLKESKKPIVVSGLRAKDMALRLKYAGVNPSNITLVPKIKHAIEHLLTSLDTNEKITILPTYTALLEMQKFRNKYI